MSYTPVAEQNGVEFRDQLGRVHVLAPDSPFRTWLLNIKGGKCTNGVAQLRFTIAHDDPSHLAVVEYRAGGEPVGWIHFARR